MDLFFVDYLLVHLGESSGLFGDGDIGGGDFDNC